jgi:hypothetical protein
MVSRPRFNAPNQRWDILDEDRNDRHASGQRLGDFQPDPVLSAVDEPAAVWTGASEPIPADHGDEQPVPPRVRLNDQTVWA